jgi:hypothetical protein
MHSKAEALPPHSIRTAPPRYDARVSDKRAFVLLLVCGLGVLAFTWLTVHQRPEAQFAQSTGSMIVRTGDAAVDEARVFRVVRPARSDR